MGLAACKAAYACGSEWLGELKEYLLGNLDYLKGFLRSSFALLSLKEPILCGWTSVSLS